MRRLRGQGPRRARCWLAGAPGLALFETWDSRVASISGFCRLPSYRAASSSNRASVSGYRRTRSTRAAACGFGLARPCSHFSSVLSLMRSLRAKTAREHRSFFRVSRISFESTFGSGAASTWGGNSGTGTCEKIDYWEKTNLCFEKFLQLDALQSDVWHVAIHFRSPAKNWKSIFSHLPDGTYPNSRWTVVVKFGFAQPRFSIPSVA